MSQNVECTSYFEYEDNGNLKTVYIYDYEYLKIEYNFTDNYEISKYANGYQIKNTFNKYGQLIYKGDLATYIYSDASLLYKTIDKAANRTTTYDYNEYGQVQQIDLDSDSAKFTYDRYRRLIGDKYVIGSEFQARIDYEYRYNLHYFSDVSRSVNIANGIYLSVQKEWDALNRVKKIVTQNNSTKNGMQIDIGYLARTVNGVGTTNYISEWKYSRITNGVTASTATRKDTFEYDINGNITKYKVNDDVETVTEYVYDRAGRLLRENNKKLNKTYLYAYDINGNITAKKEYTYTTATLSTPEQTNTYIYDRLINWNGKWFSYDSCYNPTTYKDESMRWERGRLLKSYKGYTFNYDANGKNYAKISNSDFQSIGLNCLCNFP